MIIILISVCLLQNLIILHDNTFLFAFRFYPSRRFVLSLWFVIALNNQITIFWVYLKQLLKSLFYICIRLGWCLFYQKQFLYIESQNRVISMFVRPCLTIQLKGYLNESTIHLLRHSISCRRCDNSGGCVVNLITNQYHWNYLILTRGAFDVNNLLVNRG